MESPELRGGGGEERARRMRLRRGVVAFLSRDAAPGSGTEDRSGTHVSECGRHAPSLGRFLEEGHEKLHGLEHAEGLARGAQRFLHRQRHARLARGREHRDVLHERDELILAVRLGQKALQLVGVRQRRVHGGHDDRSGRSERGSLEAAPRNCDADEEPRRVRLRAHRDRPALFFPFPTGGLPSIARRSGLFPSFGVPNPNERWLRQIFFPRVETHRQTVRRKSTEVDSDWSRRDRKASHRPRNGLLPLARRAARLVPSAREASRSTLVAMVLSRALRAASRGVSTSAAARMSLPALTTAPAKPSMLSAIFGGSAGPAMPPMDQPVPGLVVPEAPAAPAAAPSTIVTTLANGAKIASEDTQVRDPDPTHRHGRGKNSRSVNPRS